MRIAWITTQRPDPRAGAGEVLEFELLRSASRRHDVHVISGEIELGEFNTELDSLGVTYEGVPWTPTPPPRNRLVHLWQLATKDSGAIYWRHGDRARALTEALERYQSANTVDFVQVIMGEAAPALRSAHRPRALILFDSFERHIKQELTQALRLRDRLIWALELRKIKRWERRWYSLADKIACNSRADAEPLSSVLARPIEVIPNVVSESFYEPAVVSRSRDAVTLVATLGYRPNLDAVLWLTQEIWPLVVERCPDAHLNIVGRNPPDEVRRAAESVGAILSGDVEDVRPFYWAAAVAVAPIRLGSGLRNKVLHAMACGAPVVATPTALEGLDAEPGRHLLVAPDANGFADAIVETIGDPVAAAARAKEAKAFVQRFRSHAVSAAIDSWWQGA